MSRSRWTWPGPGMLTVCAAAYACVAVLFTWPLALHLSTKLTGLPGSDLGVYVWNLWVFRHEILAGRSPLHHLVDPVARHPGRSQPAQLHDLLRPAGHAAPAGAWARRQPQRARAVQPGGRRLRDVPAGAPRGPSRRRLAWLAGLLFGFSPMLMARSEIHPSLSAAAPAAAVRPRPVPARRDAGGPRGLSPSGATLAWAAICDPYYAVYCVVLAAWFLWTRAVRVRRRAVDLAAWRAAPVHVLDGVILGLVAVIAADPRDRRDAGRRRAAARGARPRSTPRTCCWWSPLLARVLLTRRPERAAPARAPLGGPRPAAGGRSPAWAPSCCRRFCYALAMRWLDGRFVATARCSGAPAPRAPT